MPPTATVKGYDANNNDLGVLDSEVLDSQTPARGTYRVNVNSRNIHHWSWSLDGGAETHMPAGSTYADIVYEPAST